MGLCKKLASSDYTVPKSGAAVLQPSAAGEYALNRGGGAAPYTLDCSDPLIASLDFFQLNQAGQDMQDTLEAFAGTSAVMLESAVQGFPDNYVVLTGDVGVTSSQVPGSTGSSVYRIGGVGSAWYQGKGSLSGACRVWGACNGTGGLVDLSCAPITDVSYIDFCQNIRLTGSNLPAPGIAIGNRAGLSGPRGENAIAIGNEAGALDQSANTIAIGAYAAPASQHPRTVVISALDVSLNTDGSGRTFVAPIRESSTSTGLFYNPTSHEVTYAQGSGGGGTEWDTSFNYYFMRKPWSPGYVTGSSFSPQPPTPVEPSTPRPGSMTPPTRGSSYTGPFLRGKPPVSTSMRIPTS